MSPALLAPLAALIFLAFVVTMALRRTMRRGAEWRYDAPWLGRVVELAGHADHVLSNVIPLVDEVRRRRSESEPLLPLLQAAATEIEICRDEAARLAEADGRLVPALVADLERAGRALDMVEHGCSVIDTTRDRRRGEGEASIKRGYLNLLHAREELRVRAREAQPPTALKLSAWRRRAS